MFFYTEELLHREVIIQKSFYTHKSLHIRLFTQRLFHREAFALKSFSTQKYTEAFTQKSFYTAKSWKTALRFNKQLGTFAPSPEAPEHFSHLKLDSGSSSLTIWYFQVLTHGHLYSDQSYYKVVPHS